LGFLINKSEDIRDFFFPKSGTPRPFKEDDKAAAVKLAQGTALISLQTGYAHAYLKVAVTRRSGQPTLSDAEINLRSGELLDEEMLNIENELRRWTG
jgi:hypothetical protein